MNNITEFIPRGINNAITQSDLSSVLNIDKRTIRAMVYQARKNGTVICSTPDSESGGYYLPESPKEAVPYVKFQQARIHSATEALRSAVKYVEDSSEI